MSEIVKFVHNGMNKITPRVVELLDRKIALLKAEFTQLDAPKFPHLYDQLEFLADVIEDFAEGADHDLPYTAVAGAAFALIYAHRSMDIVPDFVVEYGHADDSSVVRAVLIEHERDFAAYAQRHGLDWSEITTEP
ncbi:hypothetical protein QQ054_34120 [Oscillatoria amoena NRMC-F 0135]|nr:hypothetical protein [Oscillatoria laete-virens]MDL5051039.1 hypothetical protein [Oscillatoria amoena NRMC-F 0135]MDL5054488.1 hypothetical protein [Oscillatoria laete-virens NRMC-F 0139]